MSVRPIREPDWLFVPPLELPLALRLENGRFGAPRPRGPALQIHEAVDLAAEAGDPVYAAYSGRIAEVETNPAATRGNVTIDHHPRGLGFVSKYLHITDIAVGPGDFVQKGAPFARVSADPPEPHLHFELWLTLDPPTASGPAWPNDNDLVPIDPTRALYAWEVRTQPDAEPAGGPLTPQSIATLHLHGVPFFAATFPTDTPTVLHVPLYEPTTVDERLTVDLLRHAYAENVAVTPTVRTSTFWGRDVATGVRLS
jgi:murein DD-endopeptidase MepM/ murein hydrolase activator NlpD